MAFRRRIFSDDRDCSDDGYHCYPLIPPSPPASGLRPAAMPPPPPTTRIQINNKNHVLTLVVVVVAAVLSVCFLLLSYFAVIRYRSSRRRRRAAAAMAAVGGPPPAPVFGMEDDLQEDLLVRGGGEEPYHVWYIRTVGLDEAVIRAITACEYKKGEAVVEGTDCAVCLGEFGEGELLRLLPKCSHAFHVPCIDTWLRSHVNCPLCRAPVVALPRRPGAAAAGAANPGSETVAAADGVGDAAADDRSSLEAAAEVNSGGSGRILRQMESEEGSEEYGDSAILPPTAAVMVNNSTVGSSFSSEESEMWVAIDLGNSGLGEEIASEGEGGGGELQPVRRSVSMDSSVMGGLLLRMRLAGCTGYGWRKPSAGEDSSTAKKGGIEENNGKGAASLDTLPEMERSMSGGRFFLSRFSGRAGRGAILPL